jgi:hypothetical protein
MSDFKVRVTLHEHRIVDAGWTYHADELPEPGQTIEVTFDLPDDDPNPPESLQAIVTYVTPGQEWLIDAAEIEPDDPDD